MAGRSAANTDGIFSLSNKSADTSLPYQPDMHSAISNPESVVSWQESTFDSSFEDIGRSNPDGSKSLSNKVKFASEGETENSFHRRKKHTLDALMASTDMLFNTGREENKRMKAAFGGFAGLLIGGLLFVVLMYSFGYSQLVAGICALVCTFFICIGLAIFPACRCIMALVFPNFFTGKGRGILLSVIFAVMLTGPILNITHNAKETGNSMACVINLVANQTKALQNQFSDPVKDIARHVDQQRQALEKIKDNIFIDFDGTEKALAALRNDFDTLDNNFNTVYQKCMQPISDVMKRCTDACEFNILGLKECRTQCSNVNASLGDICTQLKIGSTLKDLSLQLKDSLDEAQRLFNVDVTVEGNFTVDTYSTKDIKTVQDEVNEDIGSKVISFQTFMTILKYILSLTLPLMFLQAFLYFKNYMAKDGYDNVYITKEFIELDTKKMDDGEEAILPLKKTEQSEYMYAKSLKLNNQEFANCKIGLAQVFLHFTFCIVVMIFDYFLYYILNLVHKFGDIEIDVRSSGRLTVHAKGNIASFYRHLFEGIHFNENFLAKVHIGKCLPNPTSPTGEYATTFILLYVLALCFVILRGYGIRLRRKIAAYYYPEQEAARMEYLHKTIRYKRIARQRFLRQEVKSIHKESVMKEKFRFSTWLISHCPCLAKCIPSRNKLECSSCEEREGKFSSVRLTKCPGETDGVPCTAVYCEDCKVILKGVCPLCNQEEVELRD